MLKFILQRVVQSIAVLFIVITATFMLNRLAPGDPFSQDRAMPPYVKEQLMKHYGLDEGVLVQYGNYMKNLLRGDLGPSYTETRTVNQIIADHFPVSFELGVLALCVAVVIGVAAGVSAALKANTPVDYTVMSFAMVGICLPTFVLGPIMAVVFGIWLGWFNVSGWFSSADRILPVMTLGLVYAAIFARVTRGGMLEILNQNYLVTAKAKGLSRWTILWKHALRGGLMPSITILGPALAGLISGSFVVETVFQIPGLGRYFVNSAFNRDYTVVQGTVIVYSTLIIFANLAVDVAQAALDPRVRSNK